MASCWPMLFQQGRGNGASRAPVGQHGVVQSPEARPPVPPRAKDKALFTACVGARRLAPRPRAREPSSGKATRLLKVKEQVGGRDGTELGQILCIPAARSEGGQPTAPHLLGNAGARGPPGPTQSESALISFLG